MALVGVGAVIGACGSPTTNANSGTGGATAPNGGTTTAGGTTTGGSARTGGWTGTGGGPATGGTGTGGATAPDGGTGTGGAATTNGGMTAGGTTATGGSARTGGTTTAGGTTATGGSARTGGTTSRGGGPGTGGAKGTGGNAFWAGTYDANCTPAMVGNRDESQGHHRPGSDCMSSGCHSDPTPATHNPGQDCTTCHADGSPDGSGAPEFLYGGTVYRAGTTNGVAKVEVGVKSGSTLAVACSAANGNFWVLAGPSLAWSSATTRIRDSAGEAPMQTAPAAGCNATACHTTDGSLRLSAP